MSIVSLRYLSLQITSKLIASHPPLSKHSRITKLVSSVYFVIAGMSEYVAINIKKGTDRLIRLKSSLALSSRISKITLDLTSILSKQLIQSIFL